MKPSTSVIWLFGLSGSGKTTLALRVVQHIRNTGRTALLLDADACRQALWPEVGYSMRAREDNVQRLAALAGLVRHAVDVVVVAAMTPTLAMRAHVRKMIGDVVLVHCSCALSTVLARDPKGLYSKGLKDICGVDLGFETGGEDATVNTELPEDVSYGDLLQVLNLVVSTDAAI